MLKAIARGVLLIVGLAVGFSLVARRTADPDFLALVSSDVQAAQSPQGSRPAQRGVTFPVQGAHRFTNDFGAPRMVGTRFEHRHEGTDIFAARGTPLVAVAAGVVERVGTATLGGNKVWLRTSDGYRFYYAHLDSFAPAAANGTRVQPGTRLGYVGTTGNAVGTPPHVHFEVHEPNGAALNPFPILRDIDRSEGGGAPQSPTLEERSSPNSDTPAAAVDPLEAELESLVGEEESRGPLGTLVRGVRRLLGGTDE